LVFRRERAFRIFVVGGGKRRREPERNITEARKRGGEAAFQDKSPEAVIDDGQSMSPLSGPPS
jgi:hypothetical protein